MKKAMIVQPMKGRTEEEIVATRNKAIKVLEGKGYDVASSSVLHEIICGVDIVSKPLLLLAFTLADMSFSDAVYFCEGCVNEDWCKLAHRAAKDYEVKVIFEGAKFEVGDKVRSTSEYTHLQEPYCFPPVGTIGTATSDEDIWGRVMVQWPKGSTSEDDLWLTYIEDIELVEEVEG